MLAHQTYIDSQGTNVGVPTLLYLLYDLQTSGSTGDSYILRHRSWGTKLDSTVGLGFHLDTGTGGHYKTQACP